MSEYIVFLLAFAASAAAPGPEIAALVSRSLAGGMRSSFALAIGIVIGKLLMLSAAVIGVGALLKALGPFFVVLKFGGAAYLVWIGVRKWRKAGRVIETRGPAPGAGLGVEVALGLAMTLSNPIAIAFYVALVPSAVDVAEITLSTFATLCAIVVAVMCAVVVGYGLLATAARRTFSSSDQKARVEKASGAMLVGAGVAIAAR